MKVMKLPFCDSQVMVFDLSDLRFMRRGSLVAVMTRGGVMVHLGEVDEDTSSEAQYYSVMRDALRNGQIAGGEGAVVGLGFYDPLAKLLETKEGTYFGLQDLDPQGTLVEKTALGETLDPQEVAMRLLDAMRSL